MSSTGLNSLLQGYPSEVRQLARSARAVILETVPEAVETIDDSAAVVGYGYAPGYKAMICTLILSQTGVKLGLAYGASLADPKRLLAGSGKVHRFVALRTADDLRRPGVTELLRAASRAARARIESSAPPASRRGSRSPGSKRGRG